LADSNITKKALATAFKELMDDVAFDKITISHICIKCEMNRKSFYYHFKDKYDLVNWIYYTEFIIKIKEKNYKDAFAFMLDVCEFLEQNKKFYRKVIKYDGQNSFFEYFKEFLLPIIEKYTRDIFADNKNNYFYVSFFSEAFINAIRKWLLDSENISSEKFVSLMRSCVYETAKKVINGVSEQKTD